MALPTITSQADFQNQWDAVKAKQSSGVFDQDAAMAQRKALSSALENYQTNQNVQGLYNLNQNNANTFLTDANAVTNTAGNTMTDFEKILAAGNNQSTLAGRQNAANTLFQSFNGTGSNPLLGQYNVLPSTAGTQGGILPWVNGVPGVGTAGTPASNTTGATTSGTPTTNNTTSASASAKPVGILGESTLIPGFSYPSSDASNTQPPVPTSLRTDLASLKSTYGITNPALLTYIATTPGLRDVDLKNLSLAFNSKTPQEINDMQTSSMTLNYAAYLELKNREAEIQRKKDIANPNSWIYAKGTPAIDPRKQTMVESQYIQDNQYSPLLNVSERSASAKLNELQNMYKNQLDAFVDPYGYKHINTTQGIYTFDPKGNPVGFVLPSSDYRSQVSQTGTSNTLIDQYGNFANKKP